MNADLATTYLGLQLSSPIVASASPLTRHPDVAHRLEQFGAGAIVMPSLFEEEILHEEIELNRALEAGGEHVVDALDDFPTVEGFLTTAERYVESLRAVKARVGIPVIGSLNATTPGGWVHYAKEIEDAGADALELNLYRVAGDPETSAADVEERDLAIISEVRETVDIPLAVKLSPYYSAMANFARRVADAGADGLVLFNRFYQPDYDLETLDVVPRVELSAPWELRLPLRWIAILSPQLKGRVSLAHSTGVHDGADVVKALLAGADVVMMTSAILHEGPAHIAVVHSQLRAWLDGHGYASVSQLRGSASSRGVDDPSESERADYRKMLHSWTAAVRTGPSA